LLRTPGRLAVAALALVGGALAVSSRVWAAGVAELLPVPLRGLVSGLPMAEGASLFPLLPWLAFPALGGFFGTPYWYGRVRLVPAASGGTKQARLSEAGWLAILAGVALLAILWGRHAAGAWLRRHGYAAVWAVPLHNTTLPSFCERAGWVCLLGALL